MAICSKAYNPCGHRFCSGWQPLKNREVTFPVIVIAGDEPTLVVATGRVTKGAGKMDAGFSCHVVFVSEHTSNSKKASLNPISELQVSSEPESGRAGLSAVLQTKLLPHLIESESHLYS